jgi:hypothetical protein
VTTFAFVSRMCVRCGEADAVGDLGLCESCAIPTCIEYLTGLERLEAYLGAWAAFEEWLEERELQAA